jgi:ring-1,2-phenylacetyl-CoA epoxidase subunit PaaC
VSDLFEYTLRLGDDALVAAQRTGEWIASAPQLEEDVALGNIGLDQLGQARALLQYAGSMDGRTEDDLAYFRDEREFRNLQLCELPNGDFAHAMARLLYFATYQHLLYDELRSCADETLAGVAGRR